METGAAFRRHIRSSERMNQSTRWMILSRRSGYQRHCFATTTQRWKDGASGKSGLESIRLIPNTPNHTHLSRSRDRHLRVETDDTAISRQVKVPAKALELLLGQPLHQYKIFFCGDSSGPERTECLWATLWMDSRYFALHHARMVWGSFLLG